MRTMYCMGSEYTDLVSLGLFQVQMPALHEAGENICRRTDQNAQDVGRARQRRISLLHPHGT